MLRLIQFSSISNLNGPFSVIWSPHLTIDHCKHWSPGLHIARNLQRTHWYTLTGPTDAWPGPRGSERDPGAEYVDYHLAPDPVPAPHVTRQSRDRGHVSRSSSSRVTQGTRVTSDITGNVTAHLWQSVYLRCTVTGFIQGNLNIYGILTFWKSTFIPWILGVHTVSWTKTAQSDNPIALTFNDKVISHYFPIYCTFIKYNVRLLFQHLIMALNWMRCHDLSVSFVKANSSLDLNGQRLTLLLLKVFQHSKF